MTAGGRQLTAAQQFDNLRRNPLCVHGDGQLPPGRLIWIYSAQPTPGSRIYSVRIDYRQFEYPEVYVDAPDLVVLSGGRRLPHVYGQDPPRLCLYMPARAEWTPADSLGDIVAWVHEWLFWFEEWLRSGEWRGGGEHPPPMTPGEERRLFRRDTRQKAKRQRHERRLGR